jgi:hypothetical protein
MEKNRGRKSRDTVPLLSYLRDPLVPRCLWGEKNPFPLPSTILVSESKTGNPNFLIEFSKLNNIRLTLD